MSPIRNIAKEQAIRKAVDKLPRGTCEDVKPQADYYIVTVHHHGRLRVIKVKAAAEVNNAITELT